MMYPNRFCSLCLAGLFLALATFGCHEHDPVTEALEAEAIALHDSLVVIEADVRDALEQLTTHLQAQQLAASAGDSLEAIRADLATWSSYLVEPPNAHGDDDHGHDHDHDHDHAPPPDVTPQQMVDLQQGLLERIHVLQVRLESLDLEAAEAPSS